MKMMNEQDLNIRPRPGPLPQERGNRPPSQGLAQSLCSSVVVQHREHADGGSRMNFRFNLISQLLFPLPGRKGQGEGGHHN